MEGPRAKNAQPTGNRPCSKYLLMSISDFLWNSHYMVLFRNFQTQDYTLTWALRRLRLNRDFENNLCKYRLFQFALCFISFYRLWDLTRYLCVCIHRICAYVYACYECECVCECTYEYIYVKDRGSCRVSFDCSVYMCILYILCIHKNTHIYTYTYTHTSERK